MLQRLPDVPGYVRHQGRDNDVETVWVAPLLPRRLFDIERVEIHEWIRGEPFSGQIEKKQADIGACVMRPVRRQKRQKGRGRDAGARSDFQDSRVNAGGQRVDDLQHAFPDDRVELRKNSLLNRVFTSIAIRMVIFGK